MLDKVEDIQSQIAEEDLNKFIDNSPMLQQNPDEETDSIDEANKMAKEGLIL